MADLDDFFKKRDKKKKPVAAAKTKFSVLDTEEFAKQLETITIKSAEQDENILNEDNIVNANEDNCVSQTTVNTANSNENVDEEWKPFDSDENKDYSGLRINIQNFKVEDEENNFEETNEESEKKAACPWGVSNLKFKSTDESEPVEVEKKSDLVEKTEETSKEQPEKQPVAESAPVQAVKAEEPPKTGAYISPAMKRQMEADKATTTSSAGSAGAAVASGAASSTPAAAQSAYVPPHLRGKSGESSSSSTSTNAVRKTNKAQPNIMDTMEFPTLDAVAADNTVVSNEKLTNGNNDRFEMAKKGGRVESKTNKGGMIDLDNKFTALSASNQ